MASSIEDTVQREEGGAQTNVVVTSPTGKKSVMDFDSQTNYLPKKKVIMVGCLRLTTALSNQYVGGLIIFRSS